MFLLLPSIILIVSFVILYNTQWISRNALYSIYLVLVALNLLHIVLLQPRFVLYSNYTDYAFMVEDDHEPIPTERLFTQGWIHEMISKGYILSQDNQRYTLLFRYHEQLPDLGRSDKTMVFVVIAKNKLVDFYSEDLDKDIQAVYLRDKKYQSINKQIAIQYKKFPHLNDEAKAEVEKAIVYKAGKQRIIHLTAAYLEDTSSIYSICPLYKYPNRYVYYTCKEMARLSNVRSDQDGKKG